MNAKIIIILKTISNSVNFLCLGSCYKCIDLKNKECIFCDDCSSKYIQSGSDCYPKCSGSTNYIDMNAYECLASCPEGLKGEFLTSISNQKIYICKILVCSDSTKKYYSNIDCLVNCQMGIIILEIIIYVLQLVKTIQTEIFTMMLQLIFRI